MKIEKGIQVLALIHDKISIYTIIDIDEKSNISLEGLNFKVKDKTLDLNLKDLISKQISRKPSKEHKIIIHQNRFIWAKPKLIKSEEIGSIYIFDEVDTPYHESAVYKNIGEAVKALNPKTESEVELGNIDKSET